MGTQIIVVGVIIALLVVGGRYAIRLEKQRLAELAEVAKAMQFTFYEEAPPSVAVQVGGFPLCNLGRSRRWRNVMTGKTADRDAVVGEYEYVIGSGKGRHDYRQTVAIFPGGASGLPDFTLAPENFFHKIGQVFGYQDIDFETSEEFSKHYLLRGQDEAAIRRAFNSAVLAWFGQNGGWSVQTSGGSVAVFRSERKCKPAEVPVFLADALRIQDAFSRAPAA
jgi:hypothetical protein